MQMNLQKYKYNKYKYKYEYLKNLIQTGGVIPAK